MEHQDDDRTEVGDVVQDEAPGALDDVTTARLRLRAPQQGDVAELHALYAHPQVWRDDPISRHETTAQTEAMVERWRAGWQRNGLGMWVARATGPDDAGRLVGIGGAFLRHGVAWNLGFRLHPAWWGRGCAQEVIAAATRAARSVRGDLPVTAYLLEGNARSQRTTERAGLRLVWRGPDAGNPDPAAVRLLYADRDLAPPVVQALTDD